MTNYLGRYLQLTGQILGVLLVIVSLVWLATHLHDAGQLPEWLLRTPGSSFVAESEQSYLGWIVVAADDDAQSAAASTLLADGHWRILGRAVMLDGQTVVSAAHVMSRPDLFFYHEQLGLWPVLPIRSDLAHDLAGGHINSLTTLPALPIALRVASGVAVLAYLDDDQPVSGRVIKGLHTLALQETWGNIRYPQISVWPVRLEANLGDSGGAVFNARGELLGILVGVDIDDLTLSYMSILTPAATSEAS